MSKLTCIAAVCGLVLSVSCGSDSEPEAEPSASVSPSPSETSDPMPTASDSPTPLVPPTGEVSARCGSPDAEARWITLRGPDDNRLAAVEVGKGPVTAVFSHQTGETGLCGFWRFAVWLAETHGIRSVLLDHCGVGGSACVYDDFHENRPAQLELAIEWAREHGAERLSLVGASLGGTTVTVAAAQTRVDAVVNLSGPLTWIGLNARQAAPRVTEPTLLVLAPNDSVATMAEFASLRSALGSETIAFVRASSGHGWDLLDETYQPPFQPSRVAKTITAWLQGDYVGA